MPNKKYELRSSEVQEVMSRPPAFFISWGNLVIMLLIATAVLIITNMSVKKTEKLPAAISQPDRTTDSEKSVNRKIKLRLSVEVPATLKKGQMVRLTFTESGFSGVGNIEAVLDSSWTEHDGPCLLITPTRLSGKKILTSTGQTIIPQTGNLCTVEIVTGTQSLVSLLLKRLGFG